MNPILSWLPTPKDDASKHLIKSGWQLSCDPSDSVRMAQEDQALLEKSMDASVSEEETTRCKNWLQRARYHLKTAFLFSKSDIKTVLIPQTIFIVSAVFANEPLTTKPDLAITDVLKRLPLAVLWIWMNLVICGISNQRLPDSILEDEHNKPWRPIAAKRLTPAQAQNLLLALMPLAMGVSLVVGGLTPTVTMMALLYMYNDLDGSSVNIWARNAINTGGIMCFGAGALQVLSGAELVPRGWVWIGLTGAAIATTVQALDFMDVEGDRARGRQTIPLIYGQGVARGGLAAAAALWSVVCAAFWDLSMYAWFAPVFVGVSMALMTVLRRDDKANVAVAKLWCLWMSVLYVLPVC
ncbi:Fumagillin beta-trans-bergamotene synthase [Colletotrichum orbiculare MAFF 240422]|uniref:Fumagillin beta-trans-bergamotene synthase n=1 Tax=Colletotrichum orbiculare (strain 104-T / ATCC 96160 / CBS 514.97 / LARS 414 / MAFF 240422) TaxID=1213857 RepID=A0A484FRK6_COLOR|nr:Fumagillin beta-trans-bergamotene synthase [Colletotrichum orbiculare MAFF 240422]